MTYPVAWSWMQNQRQGYPYSSGYTYPLQSGYNPQGNFPSYAPTAADTAYLASVAAAQTAQARGGYEYWGKWADIFPTLNTGGWGKTPNYWYQTPSGMVYLDQYGNVFGLSGKKPVYTQPAPLGLGGGGDLAPIPITTVAAPVATVPQSFHSNIYRSGDYPAVPPYSPYPLTPSPSNALSLSPTYAIGSRLPSGQARNIGTPQSTTAATWSPRVW